MKKAEEVVIEFTDVVYHLLLTGRYTVVDDNSGTGKSFLAYNCRLAMNGSKELKCKYKVIGSEDYNFAFSEKVEEALSTKEDTIVVIDEGALDSPISKIRKEIEQVLQIGGQNPKIHFVLIGRTLARDLPVGVKDVMVINSKGNNYYFERKFPKLVSSVLPKECTRVIFEDSTSGFKVGRAVLSRRGYNNCIPGFGKSYILSKYFLAETELTTAEDDARAVREFEPSILVLDLCGDAWEYSLLLSKMKAGYRVFVVDTESFEWECLVSHGSFDRDYMVDPHFFEPFMTEEEYYTELLEVETGSAGHSRYRKDLAIVKKIMVDYGFLKGISTLSY